MKRIFLAVSLTTSLQADTLFVEAEAFTDRGGWSVDSQFILNMGSAYLMAHGLGTPVTHASTEVTFPSTGTYHLHVRTKDWVAKWNAPGAPGKFKVSINDKPATTTFGTEGADWHWQNGGTVEITSPKTTLKLHDLTGFNGRVDALYFTKDKNDTPPNEAQALFDFRRQKLNLPAIPPTKGDYDLVVVGGGYSGLAAAALLIPWTSGHQLCPHGFLQRWLGKLPIKPIKIPSKIHRLLSHLPSLLLVLLIGAAIFGSSWNLADWEGFDAWLWRSAGLATIIIASIGLIASIFSPLAYCKYGCPTGALFNFLRKSSGSNKFSLRDLIAGVLCLLAFF